MKARYNHLKAIKQTKDLHEKPIIDQVRILAQLLTTLQALEHDAETRKSRAQPL